MLTAPLLSLFRGEEDSPRAAGDAAREPEHPAGLTPDCSLSDFYRLFVVPVVSRDRAWAADTIEQYDVVIAKWIAHAGDPPLRAIDEDACRRFRSGCEADPGLLAATTSPNTVRKNLRHLQALLDMAGPRLPQMRGRQTGLDKWGLFGFDADGDRRYPPRFTMPAEVVREPRPFSLKALAALMDACKAARRPAIPGISTPLFYETLFAWSYNVGTRIETTINLRWPMLRGEWLHVPASIVKGRQRDVVLFVNGYAREAIERIHTAGERIFPWPCGLNYLHRRIRELVRASDIPEAEKFGGTHRLRKTLSTKLQARNPSVAKLQLGHALGGDVSLKHYTSRKIVRRLMEKLPQPRRADAAQGRLFD